MDYNGFLLESDGSFGYIKIKPTGKGSVPKELRGLYTGYEVAKKAVDAHLNKAKGEKSGRSKSTPRS